MSLTALDILGHSGLSSLPKEEVQIPEWNGSIWIRGLTAAERDLYESQVFIVDTNKGKTTGRMNRLNIRARMIRYTACDQDGDALFNDGDIPRIGELPAVIIDRLFDVAQRLSGMSKEDVEELEGNSASDQN